MGRTSTKFVTWKVIALNITVIGVIILSFLMPAVPPTENRVDDVKTLKNN
jgi:predicted MFS family arabinose efflux permease